MPSELVQRLRNLHAHSGDHDTVAEAAATLESFEGVCSAHLANIQRLSDYLDSAKQHIDRIERLCREQAADIDRLQEMVRVLEDQVVWDREQDIAQDIAQKVDDEKFRNAVHRAGLVRLTDEQALRVLNAIREAGL